MAHSTARQYLLHVLPVQRVCYTIFLVFTPFCMTKRYVKPDSCVSDRLHTGTMSSVRQDAYHRICVPAWHPWENCVTSAGLPHVQRCPVSCSINSPTAVSLHCMLVHVGPAQETCVQCAPDTDCHLLVVSETYQLWCTVATGVTRVQVTDAPHVPKFAAYLNTLHVLLTTEYTRTANLPQCASVTGHSLPVCVALPIKMLLTAHQSSCHGCCTRHAMMVRMHAW